MKLWPLILVFAFGCAASKPAINNAAVDSSLIIQPPTTQSAAVKDSLTVQTVAKTATVQTPPVVLYPTPITWTWNPGGYSNFVVVTSTELTLPLLQWPAFLITTDTSFSVYPTDGFRLFSLYGTNLTTGDSAWVEK